MQPRKGRGAVGNPRNRYESSRTEAFDDGWGSLDADQQPLNTKVHTDVARSVLSFNQSPDISFDRSINPYRGCEHGCVYCYARPTHAYLGLSPGLDFETQLFCKPNAGELLGEELRKPGYRCAPIALGANTDPWQPVERRLEITRSILSVLREHGHPVVIVTKSALIERDLDILVPMARRNLVAVNFSVTTLDRGLARRMEPRAAAPERRLQAMRRVSEAGVPVGLLAAPVIPVLTDGELEGILGAAREAGANWAGYVLLRLPLEINDMFQDWLALHEPLKAEHVMSTVRQTRSGQNNDPRFGSRMRGTGAYADLIGQRFRLACKRLGLERQSLALDCNQFKPPPRAGDQLDLFEAE